MCRNDSSGSHIDVEANRNIDFYVNRTRGHRNADQPIHLSELLRNMASRLERTGTAAYFVITPELEGYYSCGTSTTDSLEKPLLVCKFAEFLNMIHYAY